jgi:hypothetical protein
VGVRECENVEPSKPEAMESRVREIGSFIMQNLQDSHCKRESPSWQNGSIFQIRWSHACKSVTITSPFLFYSHFSLRFYLFYF